MCRNGRMTLSSLKQTIPQSPRAPFVTSVVISSTPSGVPLIPLSETALYQMCCDLSEIVGAGWRMEITEPLYQPNGDTGGLLVLFKPVQGKPPELVKGLSGPYGAAINRFSLALDLPTVIHLFHQKLFPPLRLDDPPESDPPDIPDLEK